MKDGEYAHVQAIFFDNDGLLVNSEEIFFQATQDIFAPLGIEITRDWYIHENLQKGSSVFDLTRTKGIPNDTVGQLRVRRDEKYSELLRESVPVVDGVLETLEKLHGRCVMGVVTSSQKEHFDIIIGKTGLRKFFSFFITANDVENVKPDPEPYLKAVETVGLEKDRCLALEDSQRGVEAAKAAGINRFAIPDALTQGHDFSKADRVLGNMREVPPLLGL